MAESRPPPKALREGVREGILRALGRDFELRGAATAARLLGAGIVGVLGALGALLLVTTHPFGHHPSWHEPVFAVVWTGLLVVSFSVVFLQLRTPRLALGRAASVGLLALGFAGLCSLLCPDPHVIDWWLASAPGARIAEHGGPLASALCFGLATAFVFGAAGAISFLRDAAAESRVRAVAAGWTFVLLVPGVALESVGAPTAVLVGWTGGAAAGAYAGVTCGIGAARLLRAR